MEPKVLCPACDTTYYRGERHACAPKTHRETAIVMGYLPTDPKARKDTPMARGLLDYFPLACAAVAEVSRVGNKQHNPGQPMHWERGKSTDHADCIVRHLVDRGTVDGDGLRHSAKAAWRALALLQIELEDQRTLEAHVAKVANRAPPACPDLDQEYSSFEPPTVAPRDWGGDPGWTPWTDNAG